VLMHPELRQRYDLYGRQGVGTSALSDSEVIEDAVSKEPMDWTQVIVDPYNTVHLVNQTKGHGDDQDVKWKKEPPPYEESLESPRYVTGGQVKQTLNEERTYGVVVQDYQSLANTNWENCMKNSMDETRYVRPKRAQTCLYRILGVPPQATAEQLQQAFNVATEDYHPTMDLGMFSFLNLSSNPFWETSSCNLPTFSCHLSTPPAVGRNRQIYAHYHQVKKAYDILKIPALRSKYNQYGFEGLSNLKYAQAKVTNRYSSTLSEGWDPDGPAPSKVQAGIGARILNDFCAPNIAAMSFESLGIEYKSIGELGAIVATHSGTGNTGGYDRMGTVLTGGGGVKAESPISSASSTPKKRQKFFTIAPLPIGANFEAAGPIPLEDLFEMELESSDGSDDELFMTGGAGPIIAGPIGGTVQFAPLSDVQPIRFQDGASVSMNGRGNVDARMTRGPSQAGQTTQMKPLISGVAPIYFENGASVSVSGNNALQGSNNLRTPSPNQCQKLSSPNEQTLWPLSDVNESSPPPYRSSIPDTVSTSSNPSDPEKKKHKKAGRRQKFFTIAPLPIGKSYRRAPKLSVDELFEDDIPLETEDEYSVDYKWLLPGESSEKSETTSSFNEPMFWPLSQIDQPPASSIQETPPVLVTPTLTPSNHEKKTNKKTGRRQKFFTIAPLPLGKSYQRAPKLSVDELFEDDIPLETQDEYSLDYEWPLPGVSPEKSQPTSSFNEPVLWPLSQIDQPSASSIQDTPPVLVTPTLTPPSHEKKKNKKQGRRQKFFTIAPLPIGKAYQRAPKLSVEQLFEDDVAVDTDGYFAEIGDWSVVSTEYGQHSRPSMSVPFPDLEVSIPKMASQVSASAISSATVQTTPTSSRSIPSRHEGDQAKTPQYPKDKPTTTSFGGKAVSTEHRKPIQVVRLYTIQPLAIGQAYKRAPSVDKATIFETVASMDESSGEHDSHNLDVEGVVANSRREASPSDVNNSISPNSMSTPGQPTMTLESDEPKPLENMDIESTVTIDVNGQVSSEPVTVASVVTGTGVIQESDLSADSGIRLPSTSMPSPQRPETKGKHSSSESHVPGRVVQSTASSSTHSQHLYNGSRKPENAHGPVESTPGVKRFGGSVPSSSSPAMRVDSGLVQPQHATTPSKSRQVDSGKPSLVGHGGTKASENAHGPAPSTQWVKYVGGSYTRSSPPAMTKKTVEESGPVRAQRAMMSTLKSQQEVKDDMFSMMERRGSQTQNSQTVVHGQGVSSTLGINHPVGGGNVVPMSSPPSKKPVESEVRGGRLQQQQQRPRVPIKTLRSQQQEGDGGWWSDAQRRMVSESVPSALFFSKRSQHWNHRRPSSSSSSSSSKDS